MGIIWDWYRMLLHMPLGIAIGMMGKDNPSAAVSFMWLFVAYELNEDMHLKDGAYKDIQGVLAGILAFYIYDRVLGNEGD